MYSLAIIDDEKLIREGLISYIDWGSVDVEIHGVFGSAKEALAALRARMPDIILSDIKMPSMTGVELLRELRSAGSRSEVIFISAYRNFEYAKEALRHGAFDYLLKPIREELLYDTVKRCVEKIRAAEGAAPPGLGVDPESAMMLLAAPLAGGFGAGRLPSPAALEAALEPLGGARAFALDGGDEAALVCVAGIPEGAGKSAAEAVALWAREGLRGARFGYSGIARGAEAPRLRAEALWGLIGAEINGMRCPGSFAAAERYASSLSGEAPAPSRIIESLNADDRPALAALAGSIFLAFLGSGIGFDLELMKMRVFRILDAVLASLAEYPYFGEALGGPREAADGLSRLSGVYSLYRGVGGFLDELRSLVQGKYVDGVSRLVNMVASYVEDHLGADLSLERVAEECKVSPTYLSRVFGREMKESFSHFRGRARVERAKALLKDPQLRVSEIARLVGIDSVTHFTKLFCSFAGLPPTEYRKTLR
jgi:two-component system, response regulator YesN